MNSWQHTFEYISPDITRHTISFNAQLITNYDFIENLLTSNAFIEFFIEILKNSSFKAYFFEVKPFSIKTMNSNFEFVLVNSLSLLNISANKNSFENYFIATEHVVSFLNLGGDALLIVPTNIINEEYYNHLASFTRNAPLDQIVDFWKTVGRECKKRLGEKAIWLSTAGLGVSWLHLRIDSRPKYYRYKPYKNY